MAEVRFKNAMLALPITSLAFLTLPMAAAAEPFSLQAAQSRSRGTPILSDIQRPNSSALAGLTSAGRSGFGVR